MFVNEKIIKCLENTLKTAGDSTRLKILFCLINEFETNDGMVVEKSVNDIANQIGASQSLVSHQLKALKDADFIKSRKDSTKIFYSLKDEHVKEIIKITYEHILERV